MYRVNRLIFGIEDITEIIATRDSLHEAVELMYKTAARDKSLVNNLFLKESRVLRDCNTRDELRLVISHKENVKYFITKEIS